MRHKSDTIAAIATAQGRGGISIVRISGKDLSGVAQEITNFDLKPRVATYTAFLSDQKEAIDVGIAIYFPGPHSYTGEDVLELQGHGGPAVTQMLLERVLSLGIRLAGPGEFTERAYLNNKIDLAQAESIADLIEATSAQAARSALRSMRGEFSNEINKIVKDLISLRLLVEASLDFPEEEVDQATFSDITIQATKIYKKTNQVLELANQGAILRNGAYVVLVGEPNVGKSSLLNCLAEDDIALVSDIAGTTRDTIRQEIQIEGVGLHIIDTAGLRETHDPVEKMGIDKTQQMLNRANLILVIQDARNTNNENHQEHVLKYCPEGTPIINVINKADLVSLCNNDAKPNTVFVSAKNGFGIEKLKLMILEAVGWHETDGVFVARTRHLASLKKAQTQLEQTIQHKENMELMAEDLRQAQASLSEITGEFTADDLLGEIFSSFCIGK